MDNDPQERYEIVVSRSELNAILKALKHRKTWLKTSLLKKNDDNPHIEGIKESIAFAGVLTRKLLYQKSHGNMEGYKPEE